MPENADMNNGICQGQSLFWPSAEFMACMIAARANTADVAESTRMDAHRSKARRGSGAIRASGMRPALFPLRYHPGSETAPMRTLTDGRASRMRPCSEQAF